VAEIEHSIGFCDIRFAGCLHDIPKAGEYIVLYDKNRHLRIRGLLPEGISPGDIISAKGTLSEDGVIEAEPALRLYTVSSSSKPTEISPPPATDAHTASTPQPVISPTATTDTQIASTPQPAPNSDPRPTPPSRPPVGVRPSVTPPPSISRPATSTPSPSSSQSTTTTTQQSTARPPLGGMRPNIATRPALGAPRSAPPATSPRPAPLPTPSQDNPTTALDTPKPTPSPVVAVKPVVSPQRPGMTRPASPAPRPTGQIYSAPSQPTNSTSGIRRGGMLGTHTEATHNAEDETEQEIQAPGHTTMPRQGGAEPHRGGLSPSIPPPPPAEATRDVPW
jgi:hypothetical protein